MVHVYETVPDLEGIGRLRERLEDGTVDVVTFTASSTVKNLLREVSSEALREVTLAAIGPITAATLREFGLETQIEAEEHTVDGLISALKGIKGLPR